MNDMRYKWILYGIAFVIISTISIQVYWNYKNYLNSKQQLVNDVQVSLDKAVNDYYANLAEKSTIDFAFKTPDSGIAVNRHKNLDSIIESIHDVGRNFDSMNVKLFKGVTVLMGSSADSVLQFDYSESKDPKSEYRIHDLVARLQPDSLHTAKYRTLTSKVIISLSSDSLSLQGIDTILRADLSRKNIKIDYCLIYKGFNDSIKTIGSLKPFNQIVDAHEKTQFLKTASESTFLPSGSSLSINFTNETHIILKRIWVGMLISLLLVLAVISSLFYLLHIIKHQKHLAEVKNDLIGNITHEFKTPIATIGVAIESIKDFNIIADAQKTKDYLELSSGQLIKLNFMVEKLLETATLDSDDLSLDKESIDIVALVKSNVQKLQIQTIGKSIGFSSISDSILANVDAFHFENAVNNVLDNALKYGGNEVMVTIKHNSFSFTVSVSDNGNSISKANKTKIFEKFYRIPKGNTHDIKGFGIGLYYTKKIVEKHGGTIHLDLEKKLTTFKLTFPIG